MRRTSVDPVSGVLDRRVSAARRACSNPFRSRVAPTPEISVIIPVLNEEGNLEALHREVTDVLQAYGRIQEVS